MRCKIYVLIVLLGICAVCAQEDTEDNENIETDFIIDEDGDAKDEIEHNYHVICGEGDNITVDCVRKYFLDTGLCSSASHEDGSPIFRKRQIAYLSNNNLTAIYTDSDITFYGSKIIVFYINKRTSNLVMAVDFEGIYIDSKFTYFLFERRAQEPLISGDYLKANYTSTLTAVTPVKRRLAIRATRVTAYSSGYPTYDIGPKISNSTNTVIAKGYASIVSDLPTAIREIFLTESHNFYFLYLQFYICNFGLPTSI